MEGLFSTNKYDMPKVIEEKEEINVLLIRLLLMEPGTHPLHPEMGVGLYERFTHIEEDDLSDLDDEIKKQIETYLPEYDTCEVESKIENRILKLEIIIDDTMFNFTSSTSPSDTEISLSNI